MKIALDTNVLAYAEGTNGATMREKALSVVRRLPPDSVVLPAQTLGELFNVLVRKAGRRRARARTAILTWRDAYPVIDTSAAVLVDALDLATDHDLSVWDSVILSAAAEAECRLLLSEDLQEGFTWRGVTVTNPFAATLHPLLAAVFGASAESGPERSAGE
jgi:predicted nucleic acid-binding protein